MPRGLDAQTSPASSPSCCRCGGDAFDFNGAGVCASMRCCNIRCSANSCNHTSWCLLADFAANSVRGHLHPDTTPPAGSGEFQRSTAVAACWIATKRGCSLCARIAVVGDKHRFCAVRRADRKHQRRSCAQCSSEACGLHIFRGLDPPSRAGTDGEASVLGRQANWPPHRYSTSAMSSGAKH